MTLRAKAVSAQGDDVTRLKVDRGRLCTHPDAGGGTRSDQVSGQQGHVTAYVGNQMAHGENHVRRRAVLPPLPVDVEPQRQSLRIGDLVLRHQPRPDGTEAVETFALVPLRRLHLERAL